MSTLSDHEKLVRTMRSARIGMLILFWYDDTHTVDWIVRGDLTGREWAFMLKNLQKQAEVKPDFGLSPFTGMKGSLGKMPGFDPRHA